MGQSGIDALADSERVADRKASESAFLALYSASGLIVSYMRSAERQNACRVLSCARNRHVAEKSLLNAVQMEMNDVQFEIGRNENGSQSAMEISLASLYTNLLPYLSQNPWRNPSN